MTIQTTGSFDTNEELYSLSVCFENHSITLDGLTKEDLEHLQSCVNILLEINE
jgi:hypothetical protein